MSLKGIDETKKAALARELAANIHGVSKHWPIAGTAAMNAVRRRLPLGACNRFMSDPAVFKDGGGPLGLSAFVGEVQRAVAARTANVAIDEAIDDWGIRLEQIYGHPCTEPLRVEMAEGMGYLALQHGGGNCQYQAGATFMALKEAGVKPLDVIYIFRRNSIFGEGAPRHATVVIGIQGGFPNQNMPEFTRWQPSAVVADTWETSTAGSEAPAALAERYPLHSHQYFSFARWA